LGNRMTYINWFMYVCERFLSGCFLRQPGMTACNCGRLGMALLICEY